MNRKFLNSMLSHGSLTQISDSATVASISSLKRSTGNMELLSFRTPLNSWTVKAGSFF